MDVEKCEILLTALELGNIRKAADSLGYTPSGVSRAIASLEKECRMTLLVRSKNGVAATEACKQLIPHLERAVRQKRLLDRAAQGMVSLESGLLRVGTAYSQFNGALASLLGTFHQEHPGIEINLIERNSTPLLEMVGKGELDLAIASKRPGHFQWHPLVQDRLVILVPSDHPLAGSTAYPLKQLEHDSYIDIGPGEDTDNSIILQELGIAPNVCYSISTDLSSYHMVDAGLGVCLTNSLHMPRYQGPSVFLSTIPEVSVEIGIASVPATWASPAAKSFLQLLLAQLA